MLYPPRPPLQPNPPSTKPSTCFARSHTTSARPRCTPGRWGPKRAPASSGACGRGTPATRAPPLTVPNAGRTSHLEARARAVRSRPPPPPRPRSTRRWRGASNCTSAARPMRAARMMVATALRGGGEGHANDSQPRGHSHEACKTSHNTRGQFPRKVEASAARANLPLVGDRVSSRCATPVGDWDVRRGQEGRALPRGQKHPHVFFVFQFLTLFCLRRTLL